MKCKTAILLAIICAITVACMGQTFQYSRGWTNGKRADTHLHEDSLIPEIIELDVERKLERCLVTLQRLIHHPFVVQLAAFAQKNGRPVLSHHHPLENPEDFGVESTENLKHYPSSV